MMTTVDDSPGKRAWFIAGCDAVRAHLSTPIPGQSLAVIRIVFGAILLWDCWRYIRLTRIERYYVEPQVTFPYFGLDFIQPLPGPWIHILWLCFGVMAALIMVGLFTRIATVAFLLIFGYFFLLDRAKYLNHSYMVLLYGVLLALAPANRAFSLDARFGLVERSLTIPH